MKSRLTGVALAAMLLALSTADLRAQDAAQAQQKTISFAIAVDGAESAEKISTALKQVKGVTNVVGLGPQSKIAVVTYMPAQVSAQQIAQVVADVPGTAGKANQAKLLVRVVNLSDAATQEKAIAAVKKIPGVAVVSPMDANAGILAIEFAPLAPADRTGGPKGVTQDLITKALADAGLETSIELTPAASAAP